MLTGQLGSIHDSFLGYQGFGIKSFLPNIEDNAKLSYSQTSQYSEVKGDSFTIKSEIQSKDPSPQKTVD